MSDSSLGNQFNKNIQELIGIVDEYERRFKKILLENEELKDRIRSLEDIASKKDLVENDTENKIYDSAIFTVIDESVIAMLEKGHMEVMNDNLWLYLIQCWEEDNFHLLSKCLHYAVNQDMRWNHNIFEFMQFNYLVWKSTPKHDEEETPIYLYLLVLYQQLFHTSWNLEATGFLESALTSIQNQVISTNIPEVIVELLKCLLYYDLDHELGELMQSIIEVEWPFLDDNVGKQEYITFLWYAFYVGFYNKLIDASNTCNSYLKDSSPEFLLYKKYNELLEGQNRLSQVSELSGIRKKINHFNNIEETKIFFKMDKLFRNILNQKSTPIIDKVFQIKPTTENCPTCTNQTLKSQHAKIHTYNAGIRGSYVHLLDDPLSSRFEYQVGLVEENFLFCSTCNHFFGRHEFIHNLKQKAKPNLIQSELHPNDYPRKGDTALKISENNIPIIEVMDHPNSFKWPSTHAEESSGIHQNENNFQDQTALNRIGYKITGLSRIQRWDILSRKAIPTMTLKDIVYTVAMLVRVRKSQRGGKRKFAYAIAEWEHDLEKLKKEYYKKNFTWPNY